MSLAEEYIEIDLNQFHPLGCAPSASAIDAFSGAVQTQFEEYLHTRSNKYGKVKNRRLQMQRPMC